MRSGRLTAGWRGLPRWERLVLLGALAAGVVLRLGYVLASLNVPLGGDEPVYDSSAVLQTQGHWFWATVPYGIPHESLEKAPIYQVWVGLWYALLGHDPDKVRAIQAVVSLTTIVLAWLLARRLFGSVAATATAAVLAIYPNAWQFDVRLFSESLATPLTVGVLLLAFTKQATARVAAAVGVLMGVSLLLRPSSMLLFAGLAIFWWGTAGLRRGTALIAVGVGVAALVVAPWTIRNLSVDSDHLVPISAQDQAGYGTFNDDAANDAKLPYKWRGVPSRDRDILRGGIRLSDGALRTELISRMRVFVTDHPEAVPKAIFWNGIVRVWDLRPPAQVTGDAKFGKRNQTLSALGLALYWPLLVLALLALWRARRERRALVLALVGIAVATSVVYASDGGTRYRAPLEPLIVVLACSTLARLAPARARVA